MLLGVALATFIVGHGYARLNGASRVTACAIGLGCLLAHAIALTTIGSVYAAVVSRRHLRRDFFDSLTGFIASSIVVVWFLFAVGGILAIADRLFRAVFG